MGKRLERNTKMKIARAAWDLFSTQGYDETTVEDIIETSHTSRGSFYHYYEGKDALFATMSFLFDDEYQKLAEQMDASMSSFDKLLYLNHGICEVIENRIMVDMLTRMYSTQLVTHGEKHLLDRNRVYYRLLRQIIEEGQLTRSEKVELANQLVAETITTEFMQDFSALPPGETVTVTILDALPGLAYALGVSATIEGLAEAVQNAPKAVATAGGVTLTVVKPAGGSAFFGMAVGEP